MFALTTNTLWSDRNLIGLKNCTTVLTRCYAPPPFETLLPGKKSGGGGGGGGGGNSKYCISDSLLLYVCIIA